MAKARDQLGALKASIADELHAAHARNEIRLKEALLEQLEHWTPERAAPQS